MEDILCSEGSRTCKRAVIRAHACGYVGQNSSRDSHHPHVVSTALRFSPCKALTNLLLCSSHAVRAHHRRLRVRTRSPRAYPPPSPCESVHDRRLPNRCRRRRRPRPVAPDPRKVTARPRVRSLRKFLPRPLSYPNPDSRQRHSPPSSPPSPLTVAPTPNRTSGLVFI